MTPAFSPGSLVSARGREWIVLPPSDDDVLRLRPLTGADGHEVGLFWPLEGRSVHPASFDLPDTASPGDATGVMLLFDAARLSLRSGAAPFRSLGRVSVIPRPYQFVPLIMALRLDPVRMLIADDVGVGKTIESAMIAREFLDRGLASRLCVLCPAHLCDQWHQELSEKFGIDAVIVQPSRIARLERDMPRQDLSIYRHYRHIIASIDFVKSDRHRDSFLAGAADFVIVDEAHGAARPRSTGEQVQHQRHDLVRRLADDPKRHLLLVTATPHSGIEESFRSLLGLLDPEFEHAGGKDDRKRLLPHIVQRRRKDVERWLGEDTPFPDRLSEESRYELSDAYRALFLDVLDYCRETVEAGDSLRAAQRRVRHWAAIALLRCVLSSPAAAAAVLGARAERLADGEETDALPEEIDRAYMPQVLDILGDEETSDFAPTAPFEDAQAQWTDAERRRLRRFMKRAQDLAGPEQDHKLAALQDLLRPLLAEGRRPIVFCRFIQTANYLEDKLKKALTSGRGGPDIRAVTGEIGDAQRRERIGELVKHESRILIATDCLSEGINLQEHFDAVIHYDLPWNPNRLEQREGRIDRYGQPRTEIKTVLLNGSNNEVDQVVLDVLIRKAETIRRSLGIAVPVPLQSDQVVQTVIDSVLLRSPSRKIQLHLAFDDPGVSKLHAEWDAAAEREQKTRTYFGQHGIQPDEVAREIKATDNVLGDDGAVLRFLANALQRFNGQLRATDKPGVHQMLPGNLESRLTNATGLSFPQAITLDRRLDQEATYVGRTHPLVSATCDAVLGRVFEGTDNLFARAGAMYTDAVARRTVLLLLRIRYLFRERVDEFAEEVVLTAFERGGDGAEWLEPWAEAGRALADRAVVRAQMSAQERQDQARWALDYLAATGDWFRPVIDWRLGELQEAHARLRKLTKAAKLEIKPHTPPDILGCFVLVPTGEGA